MRKKRDTMTAFNLHQSGTLETLEQLRDALPSMEEGVFSHHVNDERNDFAAWANDVFGAKRLSEDMRRLSSKEEMHEALARYVERKDALNSAASKLSEAAESLRALKDSFESE